MPEQNWAVRLEGNVRNGRKADSVRVLVQRPLRVGSGRSPMPTIRSYAHSVRHCHVNLTLAEGSGLASEIRQPRMQHTIQRKHLLDTA